MKARLGVLFLLLALLSGALLTTNLSTASAAGFTARLTQARPIIGERIQVKGVIAPRGRPVQLQRYRSGRWVRVLASHTVAGGRYALPVRAASARTVYRAFAPAARIGGRRYPSRASNTVAVAGVKGAAALGFVPAPVGQTQAGAKDLTPGTATFSPARPGAPVTVQRLSGGSWTTVVTGIQSAAGRFTFSTPGGSAAAPATFRAFTRPPGVTVVSGSVRPAYWTEKWSDEFNGSSLDPTKWVTRQPGVTFGKRQCATNEASQTTEGGGNARLTITATANTKGTTTCPYGMYANAMVSTNPYDVQPGVASPTEGAQFQYGMFAARVKFQQGAGQHGAFWLQSQRGGAEMDTAEYFGNKYPRGGLGNFIHFTKADGSLVTQGGVQSASTAILGTGNHPYNGFHVYSLQWTPTEYVFRIDGVVIYRTAAYVTSQPAFPVLSLETSDWEMTQLDPTKLPSSMYVDWVRVWQQ